MNKEILEQYKKQIKAKEKEAKKINSEIHDLKQRVIAEFCPHKIGDRAMTNAITLDELEQIHAEQKKLPWTSTIKQGFDYFILAVKSHIRTRSQFPNCLDAQDQTFTANDMADFAEWCENEYLHNGDGVWYDNSTTREDADFNKSTKTTAQLLTEFTKSKAE